MPACKSFAPAATACFALLAAGPAFAMETEIVAAETQSRAQTETVTGLGPRLEPAALDAFRGGDDSVENNVDIHGQADGNTAQNTVSGGNLLGGGAFANASGIVTAIQNSGSNVLIQNGMVVNVRFAGSGP